MDERARIELMRSIFAPRDPSPAILTGIGDDAAVLAAGEGSLVWTIDAAVEGVHFDRAWLSMEDLGYRATMAAASDLAAMGAAPIGLLAALTLPRSVSDDDLEAIARGQRLAADAIGTTVVGGNLARGDAITLTTTALGRAAKPMLRSGARPGDVVWIAGPVGLAAAGLVALARGDVAADHASIAPALAAWRRPRARMAEGLAAASIAHAAIDVSDGLARDVGHIADASGLTVTLDARAILSNELVSIAIALGRDPIDLALHGGEDYALVITAPEGVTLPHFVRAGVCSRGEPSVMLMEDGALTAVDPRGFDHFA